MQLIDKMCRQTLRGPEASGTELFRVSPLKIWACKYSRFFSFESATLRESRPESSRQQYGVQARSNEERRD